MKLLVINICCIKKQSDDYPLHYAADSHYYLLHNAVESHDYSLHIAAESFRKL
jgi:hypothetical protein